jgi:hypothetical protein
MAPQTTHSASVKRLTKIYYQDEYATLELDDLIPCVKLTLRGVPKHSEHYAAVQMKRIELMNQEIKNYPKLHMLTDSTQAGPVLDEDVQYFKKLVMPTMEKAGIRYLAIVMPVNKFTHLTIRDMTEERRLMVVKYFDNLREAKQWLKRMTVA